MTPNPTRPLSIAIVSREYPPFFGGGIGTYARWIVPALTNAGIRVHVITEAHDNTNARLEHDGLTTIHRVPMDTGRSGWTNAITMFSVHAGRTIAQLWNTNQIDIVEFAECEAAGSASLMMGEPKNRIPTIVQLHTPTEQLFALRSLPSPVLDPPLVAHILRERLALRLADEVLAPSQFIASWAHDHYHLAECPTVIPYATGALPPPPPPPKADQPMTVLYAGRIEPRKGVEALILAWSGVIARHPNARLLLAGGDTSGAPDGCSMRTYLLTLLDESARKSVQFLGRLTPDALANEYACAHISVIPSLWENFPNTCIESMSNARAVLVGDAGGMREMIATTNAGLTFKAGDEHDLCEKLCSLIDEGPQELAQRGQAARQRIEEMCNPVTIAHKRIEHFQSVIESCKQRTHPDPGAMLDVWKSFEQLAASGTSDLDMPTLDPGVRKWVECATHEQLSECPND